MKNSVVFAGSVIVDTIKTIDVWPEKGAIAQIRKASRSIGGCVSNTGIDLKKLDPSVNVVAFADVGADDNGDFACRELETQGLDVSHVRRVAAPTTYTDVMALETTGERTFFCDRGAGALFDPSEADLAALDCDIFHLGYLLLLDGLDAPDAEFGTKAARLLNRVHARGIRTSFDLVSEQSARVPAIVKPVLKQSDYAVINEVEAEAITGIRARDAEGRITERKVEELVRAIFACGVRERAVIHCPECSGTVDASGRFEFLPSLKLPPGWIKGAVGAGDAFCAGMLYSFLKGWDGSRGMRLARASAAMNLASPTGTGGAKPLDETLDLERRIG